MRPVVEVHREGNSLLYWRTNPPKDFFAWAHSHMGRALVAWYEASGDRRILDALVKVYAEYPAPMGRLDSTPTTRTSQRAMQPRRHAGGLPLVRREPRAALWRRLGRGIPLRHRRPCSTPRRAMLLRPHGPIFWFCRITGDSSFGDRAEQAFFNAGPAPVARDFQTTSEEHWISWVDPHLKTPDFHVPFGIRRVPLV